MDVWPCIYLWPSLSIFPDVPPGPFTAALGRPVSLRLARSHSLKKEIVEPRLSFSRFAASLGRLASILARPDAPELDFGGRNGWIFELFRRSRTFGANCLRHRKSIVKTNTKRTSELARNDAKSMKSHSASAFDDALCC